MVRVGSDVRCLLRRHMQLWKSDNFETLLCEAERCAAQCCKRQPGVNDTCLMFRGRVREAVHFVTNQSGGGVLKPDNIDTKSGKCVLDVLKEKHPPLGWPPKMPLFHFPNFLCSLMSTSLHLMLSKLPII